MYVVYKNEKTDAKKIENISSGQNTIFPGDPLQRNIVYVTVHFAAPRGMSQLYGYINRSAGNKHKKT